MRGLFVSIVLVPATLALAACGPEAGLASGASDDAVTGTAAPMAQSASPARQAGTAAAPTADLSATSAPSAATLAVPPEMRRTSSVRADPATCNADKAGDVIGKPATDPTLAEIAARTGQRPRLTGPDHVVTADHRPDRLNAWVVAARITELWCG